jgi:hypothetical protein
VAEDRGSVRVRRRARVAHAEAAGAGAALRELGEVRKRLGGVLLERTVGELLGGKGQKNGCRKKGTDEKCAKRS